MRPCSRRADGSRDHLPDGRGHRRDPPRCRHHELPVGAGTVQSPDQLARALDSGARFAVAPGTNAAVVDAAREKGVPFVPGVATPSEVERAVARVPRAQGLPGIAARRPGVREAVAPVYPDVRFVPTGGINPGNLASYLELPSVLACAGTWICERALLSERRFDEVERRAREAVERAAVAVVA